MAPVASLFDQLLDRDSIYDSLFDHSTPATIFCTARTCRRAHRAADDYNTRTFDIHKHLKRFFANPLDFRLMQAQTGTIISGSNALQFLDRDVYPDSDIDLFVEPAHASSVCEWITYRAGYDYKFEPNVTQKDAEVTTYEEAITLQLPSYSEGSPTSESLAVANFFSTSGPACTKKIQVISRGASPMAAILSFHSSEELIYPVCCMSLFTITYSVQPSL